MVRRDVFYRDDYLDDFQIEAREVITRQARWLYESIEERCKDGHEKKLALDKLRECVMWADRSIELSGARIRSDG